MIKTTSPDLKAYRKGLRRIVLEGNSFIDFPPTLPQDDESIAQILKLNEFDLARSKDTTRLSEIHNEACGYLKSQLKTDLDKAIRSPVSIPTLFKIAADLKNPLSSQACLVLKTMSIINHIDGRELLYSCPISIRDLFSMVEDKVERSLSRMLREESLLVKYIGGRKQKDSLITKLLSKKETVAAHINDRVRYRLVTKTRADIPAVLDRLMSDLVPFNYIIPGASVNQMMSDRQILSVGERLSKSLYRFMVRNLKRLTRLLPYPISEEEHTGSSYRVLKFTVDMPVRLERFPSIASGILSEALGCIGFCLVEFQIVDAATEDKNNSGENKHALYKERQTRGVLRRLKKLPH